MSVNDPYIYLIHDARAICMTAMSTLVGEVHPLVMNIYEDVDKSIIVKVGSEAGLAYVPK